MIGTPDFLAPEQARNPMARGHPRRHLRARRHALLHPHRARCRTTGRTRPRNCSSTAPTRRRRCCCSGRTRRRKSNRSSTGAWRSGRRTARKRRCNWRWRCSRSARGAGRAGAVAAGRSDRAIRRAAAGTPCRSAYAVRAAPPPPAGPDPSPQQPGVQAPAADDRATTRSAARSEGGFPWSMRAASASARSSSLAILGYGVYLAVPAARRDPPIETFTNTPGA